MADGGINAKLELLETNVQIMQKGFFWQSSLVKRLAALLHTMEGRTADSYEIRRSLDLIKREAGLFSVFRGNMALCIAALLSMSPNPQLMLDDAQEAYSLLKNARFRASDYLAVAAIEIARHSEPINQLKVVNRARQFYDGMKANRYFSTGQDDYIYSAMLGLSDIDAPSGIERIERLNANLRGEFWDKNSVQALAQVLVLGGSDDTAVMRTLDLRDQLKALGIKPDRAYTLSSLGVLALLPADTDKIAARVGDAHTALRAIKGFGAMSVYAQELFLYASALVACDYADASGSAINSSLSTGIAGIIIAHQTAMVAAITASSTAASSSAGH